MYPGNYGTTAQTPNGNASLFIGDLSKFCTEANIESFFAPYGQITDVKIKRNNATGKTLSYGFVSFLHEESAAFAMQQLDGAMFYGRKIRCAHPFLFSGSILSSY